MEHILTRGELKKFVGTKTQEDQKKDDICIFLIFFKNFGALGLC